MRFVTQRRLHNFARGCAALTLCVAAGASNAACTQADLAGTWYVGGLATVPFTLTHDDTSFTTYCKLVVNSAGEFSEESSTCKSSIGPSAISGKMQINKICQVKGFPMAVFAGGAQIATYTVDYLKIDQNKSTFVGTGNKGSAKTGQAQFLWIGSKQ